MYDKQVILCLKCFMFLNNFFNCFKRKIQHILLEKMFLGIKDNKFEFQETDDCIYGRWIN